MTEMDRRFCYLSYLIGFVSSIHVLSSVIANPSLSGTIILGAGVMFSAIPTLCFIIIRNGPIRYAVKLFLGALTASALMMLVQGLLHLIVFVVGLICGAIIFLVAFVTFACVLGYKSDYQDIIP